MVTPTVNPMVKTPMVMAIQVADQMVAMAPTMDVEMVKIWAVMATPTANPTVKMVKEASVVKAAMATATPMDAQLVKI